MYTRNHSVFYVLLTAVLVGCGGSEPEGAPSPLPQVETGPPPISVIQTPVSIPIEQIRQLADRQLSGEIHRESREVAAGTSLEIVVNRRSGPIGMEMNGDTLTTDVPLNVTGTVSVGVGPFRIDRPEGFDADVDVRLSTVVNLNRDWSLQSESSAEFEVPRAEITIPGVQLDAATLVQEVLNRNVDRIADPLDSYLAKIEVKELVRPVWESFAAPIQISEDPAVWLQIEPEGFGLSPRDASEGNLLFDIQMTMYARSVVGSEPDSSTIGPIPDLNEAASESGSFQVGLPITVELDEANRVIAEQIVGREDQIGESATVRWLNLELSGEEGRLEAAVQFEAETGWWIFSELSGVMSVEGRPDYDPDARTLTIADMDYELESDSRLAGIADWLLHSRLRDRAQAELVFPLDEVVEEIRRNLQTELGSVSLGEHGRLEAQIETLNPQSVRVLESAVELTLSASGTLSVELALGPV